MNRNGIVGISSLLVLLVLAGWNLGWFDGGKYSDDPAVAELERARDEAFAKHEQMNDEQRRAERRALEERAKGLTPEQRWALFESSMPLIVPLAAKRFEQEYDKFMQMSAEEQRKELDKRIDEMEKRGGPQAGGPGGRGGGDRPPLDSKKVDEIRKKMLDWTTPEQRAKFENGIDMFNQRRKQRGLEPINPRPGGGIF